MEVNFYEAEAVEDALIKFVVVVARSQGKWIFCRHRERDTYEWPGGHRESGERVFEAARRELWEETGATRFSIEPIGVYSVTQREGTSFGMLYYAEVTEFGPLPPFEMESITFFDVPPKNWTYPQIQPKLLERVAGWLFQK